MLDGFAWHLQGHAIERLFDRRYLRRAYSVESLPLFGAHVIWSLPTLRLSRWSAARHGHGDRADRAIRRPVRHSRALARQAGAARRDVSRSRACLRPQSPPPASSRRSHDHAGQDLSWLFSAAADPAVRFDYAVTDLSSTRARRLRRRHAFDTAVTVRALGDGHVQRPVERARRRVRLRRCHGTAGDVCRTASTRGRGGMAAISRAPFRFRGPSPATAAHLDPDRVLALDANYLEQRHRPASPTNAPVRKWVARWIVWMQNTHVVVRVLRVIVTFGRMSPVDVRHCRPR